MGTEVLIALAGVAVAALARSVYSLVSLSRRTKERSQHQTAELDNRHPERVAVDYEHRDGTRSELVFDPADEESITRFLAAIRQEEALRDQHREPTAAG